MVSKPITELDFFRIKNQLKSFLREQNQFKDYDFDGSNMSVLLDVLSYNTYQNNFYANMAISEMFLDSAQRENSVISHAKELNYLPRSNRSAKATITVDFTDSSSTNVSYIPRNTRFVTNFNGDQYTFYTNQSYVATLQESGNFRAENVEIYEGELIEESFNINENKNAIVLNNQGVDTTSIRLFVDFQNSDNVGTEFIYSKDIFGVKPDSNIFYLQRGSDGRYEVLFGGNKFGIQPTVNQEIRVFYRIASGSVANGASRFISSLGNSSITVISPAAGGADRETIEDIKFFAPKSIQIQERAVTNRDYEVLLKQRFNEIQDVSVFGGDELDPPQYGKVAIVVNTSGGLSENSKLIYTSYLKDRTPIGIQPIFLSPKFLYMNLYIDVFYDSVQTTKSIAEIESNVRSTIKTYSDLNLNKFGSVFELSRASALIDVSDISIKSNTMSAIPYILYSPVLGQKDNPTFNFGSSLINPCNFAVGNRTEVYDRLITSSNFIFDGIDVVLEDNGLGVINIINAKDRLSGSIQVVKRNIGTVDYQKGVVRLIDFIVDSYKGSGIRIIASTTEKNVTAPKDQVLILNDSDISINIKSVSR
jgi:hypothetical protein